MKSLFNHKRYFVAVGFGVISMKSLFNTSCDKDLVDFRQFWSLKETFWQNSYRIFRFWYRYMLFRYEIGKIAHLVSHQVSRDVLKETFRTKVSLSKQVSYKTWRKRTKSVKSHISFLSEVSQDVLKETFCEKSPLDGQNC